MSGKDLNQCMIDLLYGYTIALNTDILVRKKIVSEINKLMLPYIKDNIYISENIFKNVTYVNLFFRQT